MTIVYFILAALALGILVFIHELGHYFVAKKTGMVVEIFSIGFGKPLFKWTWQGVTWQVGWLPFGGYVKILGMEVSKKEVREPYEIPNGFFSKSPLKRIAVAIAGPLANFALALLIFCGLWAIKGREKPFSDYSHIVGWVDPKSPIYEMGLRPGDTIQTYNDKSFTGSKDLLYAAMLSGDAVTFTGEKVNYVTGEKKAYSYTAKTYPMPNVLEDIQTTGVMATARYLIYDPALGGMTPGSPLEGRGLETGDRLVWADGELLFSMEQLSAIANSPIALLTIKRADEIFLSKQPRALVSDLNIPPSMKEDLEDWRYENGITGRLQDVYTLPYTFSNQGVIEGSIDYLDHWGMASSSQMYPEIDLPLEVGDVVLAIDGVAIASGLDLFAKLQTKQVSLIVEKGVSLAEKGNWEVADQTFDASWDVRAISHLASQLGTTEPVATSRYRLLASITPKPLADFNLTDEARAQLKQTYDAQLEQILTIKQSAKRDVAIQALQASYQKKIFGIALADRKIRYNPNPIKMFGLVFQETWHTLKALVLGYLHPKWLSGPVGIVRVIHHGWRVGLGEALFWIGAISVNLGFLNLLPIPVLDGGYICLSLVELITKRRLKARTMEKIVIPFVVLLIALLVFLTFQDISRLFS